MLPLRMNDSCDYMDPGMTQSPSFMTRSIAVTGRTRPYLIIRTSAPQPGTFGVDADLVR